ncbi:TPA: hypothetical protein DCR79_01070 [Patescibacteria group bacterium]|nr:hypothetical protein [Patescibacteria group bacterium]HCR41841.1 hypothetical protein [Patescibacteria group bacterium]
MSKYDGTVETTACPLIINDKDEILLIKSPKWGDKYILPGGHIEHEETIVQAVIRETKEETGLDVKPLYLVNIGSVINDPFFKRKAHFVFLDIACQLISGEMKADIEEVSETIWVSPEEALKLPLIAGVETSIRNYLAGVKMNIDEYVF